MMEIKARTKKWGNSIGILIPKEAVRHEKIKPNQEIVLTIGTKPKLRVKDIFGKLTLKKSTEELMREVDKELDSKFFRK